MHVAAVRRLTRDESIGSDFADKWRELDLDEKTRALLTYASKLTEYPNLIEDADIDALKAAGWGQRAIWEATTLISLFNMSGRLEAASGLPEDQIPEGTDFPEALAETAEA